ncbi:CHASE domain-containing protein [Piscinibacter sp.]|uniref:CHASE domain-containing protein n=1 Tax=Piscinibacter sp. TaxID=1903157 RepID=UPI002C9445A8|nr:CHASE domain-containing protein [Albitalea sp.]HUG23806.1 CHASE domain-containing protein [Albitalea sp.]
MNKRTDLRTRLRWALQVLGTALVYGVVGNLALRLAIPTGYASPLYPSAGIALVCVLVYGPRAAIGVALGAFGVNWLLNANDAVSWTRVGVPLIIAGGAMLQALAGAWLVRRFVRQPLTLSEPHDIAVFFGLGAAVACLISASIATTTLGAADLVAPASLAFNWLTWWIGDTLGTLIGAPIALTLIGRPRADWAPRRLNVGLTLAMVTVLMAAMIVLVARWDEERIRNSFEREAVSASSTLAFQLQAPLHALEALRGIYVGSDGVDRDELRRATKAWLEGPGHLQAMGFNERVRRADVPAFEAAVRAEGLPDFHVFDRRDGVNGVSGAAPAEEVFAMRYIEPFDRNRPALGVNALSIPAARTAIDTAVRTDRPAATPGFKLTQDPTGIEQTGVVVYHAIYDGEPATAQERIVSARGVVFVTLRLDDTLRTLLDQIPRYLTVCVVDTDPLATRRRLSGPAGCEAQAASLLHVRPIAFAGRQWDVRVYARTLELPNARDSNAWPFSVVGLMAAAVLGALLLTVTGRAHRIELAVRERTAALTQQIHEREQAEAAMRASEQRFRNIFNNVPIGVCYTDLRGNVKQTNPRFCELVGYSADELMRMTAADFTHPDDVAQDREFAAQLVNGDFPLYRRHKRFVAKTGRIVWAQTTVSLLRNEAGEPWRIVGAVEDITEHLRLAEAERAREAAEVSNRAKSEFLSRMSHELRTPLNAMLGFAQLLDLDQRRPLDDAQRPWVTQIQQAGWHLLEMINDVLDLSRIESGNLRLSMEPLDLAPVLASAVTMLEGEAHKRGIIVTDELAPDATLVLGDATRVKQILINLLSNAVKYNVEQGRVHVASRLTGDMVEIVVTDTGLGMTAEQLGELFQPFNRLGRERSQQEGTGIGLVISQRLAELMGGSLRARSVADEGSSFILTLPAVSDPSAVRRDDGEPTTGAVDYHRRIVHYVEDNETNVEVMRGVLAQRPQVAMDVSVTGLDGLAAIRAHRPDVILLDMHLPDISGMELLRHLKADPSTAGIPVVVVSADALEAQIEAAREAGAMRYLTKPVSVAELLGVLDEVLDQVETRFG